MPSRHFVADNAEAINRGLAGFCAVHADLVALHPEPRFVVRARPARDKVALVSGGGSGHEPLHAGFVGEGMLDAAVDATLVCRFNDLEDVEATVADHPDQIAAIIVEPIAHRRPWENRSRNGPISGATIAKGSIVSPRNSATWPRASPEGTWKNSDPASEIATAASPAVLKKCR